MENKKLKIGFQGVKGAFSYVCAKTLFPNDEIISFESFTEVANAVESGEINYGILPYENIYAGEVVEVKKILQERADKIKITDKTTISVIHNLCGLLGAKMEDITHIFSHWQALKQCQKTLQKIAPNAVLVEKENTAMSAEYVKKQQNKNYACICSKMACEENNLEILKEAIQDSRDNRTTFVVLKKK